MDAVPNAPVQKVKAIARVRLNRSAGELLTPMTAIRSQCLGCCGGSAKEVALCPITDCPLWPYRLGKKTEAARIVAEERTKTGLASHNWAQQLQCYTSQAYYRRETAELEGEEGENGGEEAQE